MEEINLGTHLDILELFNERMNNPKLKKRYIKVDIAVAYDSAHIQQLLVTSDIDEYKHLMRCYDITEQELKRYLWELRNPNKPYIKSRKWRSERTFSEKGI